MSRWTVLRVMTKAVKAVRAGLEAVAGVEAGAKAAAALVVPITSTKTRTKRGSATTTARQRQQRKPVEACSEWGEGWTEVVTEAAQCEV
jgi:hypothetical protein